MSSTQDEKGPSAEDAALIRMIREQTEWGERSEAERHAFRARLGERLDRRRFPAVPALVAAAGFAALAAAFFSFGSSPPAPIVAPPGSGLGAGFLSAAYYADSEYVDVEYAASEDPDSVRSDSSSSSSSSAAAAAAAKEGRPENAADGSAFSETGTSGASRPDYWPAEYVLWADAIWTAPESAEAGTL